MGKSIRELIDQLPTSRKAKVEAKAQQRAADMIAEADSLESMRKAVNKTQVQVAKELGIGQNAVSQLESRTEIYVSTLRRYVQALGLDLEIALLTKEGERIALSNFHPWTDEPAIDVPRAVRASARAATAVTKPSAAKARKKANL